MDTQNDTKKLFSPMISRYALVVNPTGQKLTSPASAADFELKETARLYKSGSRQLKERITRITTNRKLIHFCPAVFFSTLSAS